MGNFGWSLATLDYSNSRPLQGRDCQSRQKSRQGDQAARWSWSATVGVEGEFLPGGGFLIFQEIPGVCKWGNFDLAPKFGKYTTYCNVCDSCFSFFWWFDGMVDKLLSWSLFAARQVQTDSFDQTEVRLGAWSSWPRPSIPIQLYSNIQLDSNIQLTYMWCQVFGWTMTSHDLSPKGSWDSESQQQKHFPLIAMKEDQHLQHEVYRFFEISEVVGGKKLKSSFLRSVFLDSLWLNSGIS